MILSSSLLRLTLLSAIILCSTAIFGQDLLAEKPGTQLNHFFQSSKTIAKETFIPGIEKLDASSKDIVVEGSNFTRDLHLSSDVIFTAPVVDYLNELKDKLLKDSPALRDEIQVFGLKSPYVNAFATVNSNIYMNVGLFATLENEAQLAFVLCHEISHITGRHILEQQLTIEREIEEITEKEAVRSDDFLLERFHKLSRADEYDADAEGLKLYLASGLPIEEARRSLALLRKADDSISDLTSRKSLLFIEGVQLLDDFWTEYDKFNFVATDTSKVYLTHPSIEDRIAKFSSYSGTTGDKISILNADKFIQIHNEAKSLNAALLVREQSFVRLFLDSYVDYANGSKESINDLCYSLQGLTLRHLRKDTLNYKAASNQLDSVFCYFFNEKRDVYLPWISNALRILDKENHELVSSYKKVIDRLIIDQQKRKKQTIDDVDFSITPYVNLTKSQIKEFTVSKSYVKPDPNSKIAIYDIRNIHLKFEKDENGEHQLIFDGRKVEKQDLKCEEVVRLCERSRPNNIVNLMPNGTEYNSEQYNQYSLINDWFQEYFSFEGYNINSYYQKDAEKLKSEGIDYAMVTLNAQLPGINIYAVGVPIAIAGGLPFAIPQMVVNAFFNSKRKFQLTMIFDIEKKQLVFWDKRTFTNVPTLVQLYHMYDGVIESFFNQTTPAK